MEDFNPTLLELIGEKTNPPGEGEIGAPVMEQWYFRAKAGETSETKVD
jgi:hypothetical protein